MGDTGSLMLGGAMAVLAILLNTQLLLVVLGGLYVVETLSVIVQVGCSSGPGRRSFLMAPIHHHFELAGWAGVHRDRAFLGPQSGLSVAFGLGLFYADFISKGCSRPVSRSTEDACSSSASASAVAAAARALLVAGREGQVTESNAGPSVAERADGLRSLGAEVEIGGHDLDSLDADLAVVSPGITPDGGRHAQPRRTRVLEIWERGGARIPARAL